MGGLSMATKKGIRQSRKDYIKRDIRELQKLGFDEVTILNGRSIESLAYTQKSYDRYRKHIRALKKQSRTNTHGITFTKKQMKEIRDLEKEFNQIKDSEFKRLVKSSNLSPIDLAYLKGKEISSNKYPESIKLGMSFGKENIFDSINNKNKYESIINLFKDLKENFTVDNIIDNGRWFDKIYLANFEEYGYIDEDEREILNALFQELSPVQKSFVKNNIDYLMRKVESVTNARTNPLSHFSAINELIIKESQATYNISKVN